MYVLAYTNDKHLTVATDTLKSNLKTYLSQYRVLTDAINIKDAFIVNIGIRYDVVLRPGYIGRDVLLKCTEALKAYFEITKWSINQPINLSEVYTALDKVKGVQTVQNVETFNKVGGSYSQYGYDLKGATKNNIVYPSYDPCIFEVKFPDIDIEGRITSL
jgi:phage-related baseplate assembly protein